MLLVSLLAAVLCVAATPQAEYHARAKDLIRDGEFLKAGEVLNSLFKITDMKSNAAAEILKEEAYCWKSGAEYEKAIFAYQLGCKLYPARVFFPYALCNAYTIAMDAGKSSSLNLRYHEALDFCILATEMSPENPIVWKTLADFKLASYEYSEAVEIYRKVFTLDNNLSSYQFKDAKKNLKQALMKSGNLEESWKLMLEILESDRDFSALKIASFTRGLMHGLDQEAVDLLEEAVELFTLQIRVTGADICPRGIWQLSQNHSEIAELYTGMRTQVLNPYDSYVTYGNDEGVKFFGPSIVPYPLKYHEKIIQGVHFDKVFMAGRSGIIHGDCQVFTNSLFIDVDSFPLDNKNVQLIEIEEPVFSIVHENCDNYYHFILDIVPRLHYFFENFLLNPEKQNTKLLVSEPPECMHYLAEILKSMGIEHFHDLVIKYPTYTSSNARLLLKGGLDILDWIHPSKDLYGSLANNVWSTFTPPRQIIKSAREIMLRIAKKSKYIERKVEYFDILYVSRKGQETRKIPNEEELIRKLGHVFGKRFGVNYGNTGILEQVEVFSKARVVIGGHGAGLVNYIFTPPDAILILLVMKPHVEYCFGNIAAALGRRHFVMSGIEGTTYYGNYPKLLTEDIQNITRSIFEALKDKEEL